MGKISRRTFVATAAAAGAATVLRSDAFALQQETPPPVSASAAKQFGREAIKAQAVPFPMDNVRLGPGALSCGRGSQSPLFENTASRPAPSHLSPDRRAAYLGGASRRLGEA